VIQSEIMRLEFRGFNSVYICRGTVSLHLCIVYCIMATSLSSDEGYPPYDSGLRKLCYQIELGGSDMMRAKSYSSSSSHRIKTLRLQFDLQMDSECPAVTA
jgi:hypothetical protein